MQARGVIGALGDEARGEAFGLFVDEWIVEQVEGLQRRGAGGARGGAGARVGSVEDGQIGMPLDALRHEIDAAFAGFVGGFERVVLREFPVALRRKGMRAAGRAVERAAEGEQGVADAFGVEAAAGKGGEQRVVRVLGEGVRVTRAGEAVGAREHDGAVQFFHRPAFGDEARGEPVEQFGMGRWLALFAKIVRRRDESFSEMLLPDAVRHDARGERIGRVEQPVGEAQASAGFIVGRKLRAAEHGEKMAAHDFAGFGGIAFHLHGHVGDAFGVGDGVGDVVGQRVFLKIRRRLFRVLDLLLDVLFLRVGRVFQRVLQLLHFLLQLAQFGIARLFRSFGFGEFFGRDERHEIALFLLQLDAGPRIARAVEDAVKRVVILRGDGIEFVIVAARAIHGEAEEGASEIVDRVLDGEVLRVVVHARAEAACVGDVAGGDDLIVRARGQQIAGDLRAHKLIVRQVGIEGRDDPVAILVHLRDGKIRVVAGGVGVAHHVEPVPAPAFAVRRGGEEAVEENCAGLV